VRRRKIVIGIVATLALVGGSLAVGAAARAATTSYLLKACVSRDGTMRAVPSYTKRCSQGRKLLVWNIRGQRGSRGSRGSTGSRGATGTAGTPGASVVLGQETGVLAAATTTTIICPATNQLAIGGGFAKAAADAAVDLVSSIQDPANPRAWVFTFAATLTAAGTTSVTCASVGAAATPAPTTPVPTLGVP
jgi:hypothetical protein